MKNIYLAFLLVVSYATQAQVPVMSSYPSAAPTIFLDFDGHTVNGTQWNTAGTIACGPANLNTAQVSEIFNRIAEDYRPFNVNVTTDSTRYWSAPSRQRMRVIFTISNAWYGNNVGGVAYINSFTWGDNTPCFIFTALLNNNVKFISEAGAHEAGHTLGLRHQASYDGACVKLTDYNSGTGTGEIGWAPIMGVGYYKNLTTWNLGPTSLGCTTVQNDLNTITKAANGITFRTDEHAGRLDSATVAPIINNRLQVSGVIARTEDQDYFKFTVAKGGRLQLNAVPYNIGTGNAGSNLDLQVQLFNAAGTQLGIYNPAPLLNSVIDTSLEAGAYYLVVEGKGNQFAAEYGSLGSYALEADFREFIVLPLHQLSLGGQALNGAHKLKWNIVADERVTEQVLQVATNGIEFSNVANVPADDRTYTNYSIPQGNARYRLRVTLNDGKTYYSNIFLMRAGNETRPKLVTNNVEGQVLSVQLPSATRYVITDYSGRTMVQGRLAAGPGRIDLPNLAAGMYLVRFSDESGQYVEKFVKQ